MNTHLLAIAVGPVQGFIAAARRTRDLWCGSQILSEISKATAKCLVDAGARLIFPALDKDAPELLPVDRGNMDAFNVANVILAEVPEGLTVADLAAAAREAAQARWFGIAQPAMEEAADSIDLPRWKRQVKDVIEVYVAWTPMVSGAYCKSRRRVMRLLAAAKASRTFCPDGSDHGLPKSSLDGARDTLWKDHKKLTTLRAKLAMRLRLSEGEQLDAVGLTKRLAFGAQPYPSVSRIAAEPWLRGLATLAEADGDVRRIFQRLKDCAEYLTKLGLARVAGHMFAHFPYEGTAVYRTRHAELLEQAEGDGEGQETIRNLTHLVGTLIKRSGLGEPDPYLAVLVADGDRVGKVISRIDTPNRHRDFSRKLARFAAKARRIVEDCHGCLIYSGGDDVLALVPTDKCLDSAKRLHDAFGELLSEFATPGEGAPTLSVGVSIGHFMEPLDLLLQNGRDAERDAKTPNRDGLAVHVHTRGGAPLRVKGTWSSGIWERLMDWKRLHLNNAISQKTPYDMRALASVYSERVGGPTSDKAVESDLRRLLCRKSPRGRTDSDESLIEKLTALSTVPAAASGLERSDYHPGVFRVAQELLAARRIASAARQAGDAFHAHEKTGGAR